MARTDLSHYRLLTGDMGKLIPISVLEALPGDVFRLQSSALVRLSPMAAPVMHGMTVRIHHFYVPNRIVWDGWEDFITGGADGMDISTIPTFQPARSDNDYLDYCGITPDFTDPVNVLPALGHAQIYNQFYRDQDLIDEIDTEPGYDENALNVIRNIAWGKDRFTTARPWEQKGPGVTIPLGQNAPVGGKFRVRGETSGDIGYLSATSGDVTSSTSDGLFESVPELGSGLYADLQAATGINIQDFRRALAVQRFQEDRARYGSRYDEVLRSDWGVRPSDGRLQQPEYLGGGRVRLNVSEVLQTAPETSQPGGTEFGVGDLYGHGIGSMRSNAFRRFIPEHGYVHSYISVRPDAIYAKPLQKHWIKQDREDYYHKHFAHIGQEAIETREVDAAHGDNTVFGYNDRYMEYRTEPSTVAAEFRTVLDYWHMARDFAGAPALNKTFVECTPSKRIFNVQQNHVLWMMINQKARVLRRISSSSQPRITM